MGHHGHAFSVISISRGEGLIFKWKWLFLGREQRKSSYYPELGTAYPTGLRAYFCHFLVLCPMYSPIFLVLRNARVVLRLRCFMRGRREFRLSSLPFYGKLPYQALHKSRFFHTLYLGNNLASLGLPKRNSSFG